MHCVLCGLLGWHRYCSFSRSVFQGVGYLPGNNFYIPLCFGFLLRLKKKRYVVIVCGCDMNFFDDCVCFESGDVFYGLNLLCFCIDLNIG